MRSKKTGRFEKMLHFDSSQPILTRGSRVSRAPPHHTLPAFLDINGSISIDENYNNKKISDDFKYEIIQIAQKMKFELIRT